MWAHKHRDLVGKKLAPDIPNPESEAQVASGRLKQVYDLADDSAEWQPLSSRSFTCS